MASGRAVPDGRSRAGYALRSMTPSAEPLPARPAEAHALAVARTLPGNRIVCTTAGRGQAAHALAAERPEAVVTAWFLDLHPHDAAVASWSPQPTNLSAACTADMPPGPYDLAVVPLSLAWIALSLALGRALRRRTLPADEWIGPAEARSCPVGGRT